MAEWPIPTSDDVRAFLGAAAEAAGIDWRVPDVIVRYEGGYDRDGRGWTTGGDAGLSFGPFQLYYGGGLGNAFTRDTGLDARDRSTWQEQILWSINYIAAHYDVASLQSQWHGVRDNPSGAAEFLAIFGGDTGGGAITLPIVGPVSGYAAAAVLIAAGIGVLVIARRRG